MTKGSKYNEWQLAALAATFGRSTFTIRRWEKKKDDRLECPRAIKALKNLKIPK